MVCTNKIKQTKTNVINLGSENSLGLQLVLYEETEPLLVLQYKYCKVKILMPQFWKVGEDEARKESIKERNFISRINNTMFPNTRLQNYRIHSVVFLEFRKHCVFIQLFFSEECVQ